MVRHPGTSSRDAVPAPDGAAVSPHGSRRRSAHVSALLRELGAPDRTQAVVAAYESGLVPLP